ITNHGAAYNIDTRPATWTTNPRTKTYGDADPSPLTAGSGTFLAADNVTATYGRAAGSNVGTYHITATLGPPGVLGNYNITNNGADFTISKAMLSVSADDKTMTLNSASLPTLTASYSGFKNGETLTTSGVTGSPSLTTTATPSSPVGPYTITAALGS